MHAWMTTTMTMPMTNTATANSSCSLTLSAKDVPYGALVLALLANAAKPGSVLIAVKEDATTPCVLVSSIGLKFTKLAGVMRYLARVYLPDLYESHFGKPSPDKATTIDNFLSEQLPSDDLTALKSRLAHINTFLALRSFMVGYHLSLADFFLWSQLKSTPMFTSQLAKSPAYPFLLRWFRTVDDQPSVALALGFVQDQVSKLNKQKKDQGSFDIALPDASMGNVVTRFPPEPSGYLHIGHAKAALMNEHFARKYNGKMIVRFDDTNPDKEKMEFEQSIMEDLALLGIQPDLVTHTSDHFPILLELCEQMIRQGDAYVDDTDQETMRNQRMHGLASACRDNSVQENLRRWKEMQAGTDEGLRNCVRAKLSIDDKNKALRDPVLYRTNLTPHHKVGNRYKVYPTYDFACPVVDSIEGVTHALRTNEYRDRNPQYEWVISKLGLRKVHIWDFSRMNFVYTLLSKRKLQWFVDQGHVAGWDDPRFPTVRGIRRRGMTIEALRQYILMQGASTNTILLEWDKFWAVNKKVIDPVAPRHVGLDAEGLVPVTIVDGPAAVEVKPVPKHKKNPDVGNKDTAYFKHIVLAGADVQDLADGEEVTLMDWGNVIVTKVHRDAKSGTVAKLDAKLNLAGDVKATRKKLTWLVDAAKVPKTSARVSVPLTLKDYDYLITKKKLEEDDDFQSVLTPTTEFVTKAVGDANLAKIYKGEIVQLERRGYFIADEVDAKSGHVTLIAIPDGKAASLASKHGAATAAAAAPSAPKKESPAKKSGAERAAVKKNADPSVAAKSAAIKSAPLPASPVSRSADALSSPSANGSAVPRSASRSRSKSPARKTAKAPIMYPVANVYGDNGFPFDDKVFDIMYGVQSVYDKEH